MRLRYLLVGMLTLSLFACRSPRKIQTSIQRKDTTAVHIIPAVAQVDSLKLIHDALEKVKEARHDYRTFSARIKVEYQDAKGKQPNITAYVRMIKDSLIWVSGYATVFNVEAFRALITKDSVIVVNKIDKEVQYRSIDFLQEVSAIPFNLNTLQDLLVGNPVFLSDSVLSYKETESRLLLAMLTDAFKHLLTLQKDNRTVLHSKLDDLDITRNRTADITYSDYDFQNVAWPFARNREIVVSEKNKLEISLSYKEYVFDKEVQVNFSVPKKFKRL